MGNGLFIVSDGLDGIGKSVILESILEDLKNKGKNVFDVHEFWEKYDVHPDFKNENSKFFVNLSKYDVLYTSEPTFVGIGKEIRNEITANNGRQYSAWFTAHAYAMDRMIFFKNVVIPALEAGKIIVQSRSVSTSIVYQPLQKTLPEENSPTIHDIMNLEGNALALQYAPDLLLFPTIKNAGEVIKRLNARKKEDNSEFENLDFQMKIKPLYESKELRDIFESRGSKIGYVDVSRTIHDTVKGTMDVYSKFMVEKGFFK